MDLFATIVRAAVISSILLFCPSTVLAIPDSECECPGVGYVPMWTDPDFPFSGYFEVDIEPSNSGELTDVLYCNPSWLYQVHLWTTMVVIEPEGDGDYCVPPPPDYAVRWIEWFPGHKPAEFTATNGGQIVNQNYWTTDVRYLMPEQDLLNSDVEIAVTEPLECDIDDTGSIRTDSHAFRLWRGPYFSQSYAGTHGMLYIEALNDIFPRPCDPDGLWNSIWLREFIDNFQGEYGDVIQSFITPTAMQLTSQWGSTPVWIDHIGFKPCNGPPLPPVASFIKEDAAIHGGNQDGIVISYSEQTWTWQHTHANNNLYDQQYADEYVPTHDTPYPLILEINYQDVLSSFPNWVVGEEYDVVFTITRDGVTTGPVTIPYEFVYFDPNTPIDFSYDDPSLDNPVFQAVVPCP
jgi:hypothetical protein